MLYILLFISYIIHIWSLELVIEAERSRKWDGKIRRGAHGCYVTNQLTSSNMLRQRHCWVPYIHPINPDRVNRDSHPPGATSDRDSGRCYSDAPLQPTSQSESSRKVSYLIFQEKHAFSKIYTILHTRLQLRLYNISKIRAFPEIKYETFRLGSDWLVGCNGASE